MTGRQAMADWRQQATRARWRYWGAWIGSPLLFVVGLAVAGGGLIGDDSIALAAGAVLAAAGLVWSTVIYIRVVDEQERDATLWASYAAICVYFALFVARWLPILMHRPAPFDDRPVFVATMIAFLLVFSWKRFR